MSSANSLASIGSQLADPSRAEILVALMDGRAYPAGDLAAMAHVSPPTASHHLAKLVEGGLIEVFRQGRHRYYRLTGHRTADLLESMGAVGARAPAPRSKLSIARTCYDHLAGELGVGLRKRLEEIGAIRLEHDRFEVSSEGVRLFANFGILVDELSLQRRPLTRACLDWTERVPHLGGSLGAALLTRIEERRWIQRIAGCRAVSVTPLGAEGLALTFGLSLPSNPTCR